MNQTPNLSVILLHEDMLDKHGTLVTTSLTLIDVHDIARSARTFGLRDVFIAHPSPTLRKLTRTLKGHWQDGFGASYNPNRKEALEHVQVVSCLDEAVTFIEERDKRLPTLIATSARPGADRVSFKGLAHTLRDTQEPFLLMLGTGWGMSDALLARAKYFLEPISGPGEYNHLSVRSACAILLDRLLMQQHP